MNWKLVLSLSLFGAAMGVASIFGFIEGYEPVLWPLIGIFCAVWIAKKTRARHFVHGFLAGFIGGGIAPLSQALFFSKYLANNPKAAENLKQLPPNFSAETFLYILAPLIAVISGLFLGLLSWVAGKIIKRHE